MKRVFNKRFLASLILASSLLTASLYLSDKPIPVPSNIPIGDVGYASKAGWPLYAAEIGHPGNIMNPQPYVQSVYWMGVTEDFLIYFFLAYGTLMLIGQMRKHR